MITFSRLIKGKVSIYRKTTLLENGKFYLGNGSSRGRKKCFQAQYTIGKSKDWWSLLNHNLNSSHNSSLPLKSEENPQSKGTIHKSETFFATKKCGWKRNNLQMITYSKDQNLFYVKYGVCEVLLISRPTLFVIYVV